jgi:polyisoprenoid-binding protein YceI
MTSMKALRLAPAALLSLLVLAACNTDQDHGRFKALVSEPAVQGASASPDGAARYTFSAQDSKVGFVGAKITGKHEGSFGSFSGRIDLVNADPTKSNVVVDIDTASLRTDTEKLSGHLKSADFFDVEKYPKARFVSTSVRAGGERGATHTITGNLELHGVTKSISFPATISTTGSGVTVDSEFSINRKDFGLVYPGMPDDLIKDDVVLKLGVHATPPKA